jgi:hypothetical protein
MEEVSGNYVLVYTSTYSGYRNFNRGAFKISRRRTSVIKSPITQWTHRNTCVAWSSSTVANPMIR